jgi:multimeric flavodoxin WrbA/putative sterol carrier protein
MKVLALNSSARVGDVSKTEIMLDSLVEGMRGAGAEVEIINLAKKKIKNCIGCFTCWSKTPGICVHKDDMTKEVYPKYLECDLCILATPLYIYTVNAQMKTFLDRMLPCLEPFFVKKDGVTRHPLRHEVPKVAVISAAGFPEESVFDQLKSYVNYLYKDRLVAEIYRTSAEQLRRPPTRTGDILDATIQGGRELVKDMKISPDTMARIKRPITDFDMGAPIINLAWQNCIDDGVIMGEFQKKKMIPRPNSIATFLSLIYMAFNQKSAGDAKASIQYRFSGQVDGECYIIIDKGKITASPGTIKNSDLTIDTPFEVWMDIMTKKSDGAQMFFEGKYKVEGNTDILMKMNDFFGES